MAGVNKVIILGRLGADPELRSSPSGVTTCNLSIATSINWTDKNSGDKKEKRLSGIELFSLDDQQK